MDQRHFPTIIVGGGIAGLYLATKLPAALLLERRMKVGGRVRTVRTEEGMYEAGPWRVHESHKNMLSLLKEYGLTVKPNTSSTILSQQPPEDDPAVTGFSQHDVRILHHGAEYARKKDVLSGYEGLAVAASDANVYHANRHVKGTYQYIVEGFSALVENMAKACEGRVRTAHLVTDIRREGGVYHVCLQGKDTLTCDEIFCCVPPRFMDEWPSVREWVAPQAACVRTAPLHHICHPQGRHAPPTDALPHHERPWPGHQRREPLVSSVLHVRGDSRILESLGTTGPNSFPGSSSGHGQRKTWHGRGPRSGALLERRRSLLGARLQNAHKGPRRARRRAAPSGASKVLRRRGGVLRYSRVVRRGLADREGGARPPGQHACPPIPTPARAVRVLPRKNRRRRRVDGSPSGLEGGDREVLGEGHDERLSTGGPLEHACMPSVGF